MSDYIREGAIRRLLKDIDPEARIGAEALETLADYLTDYAASCLKRGIVCADNRRRITVMDDDIEDAIDYVALEVVANRQALS